MVFAETCEGLNGISGVLHTAYCILLTAYCILHTAYCIPHTGYCIPHNTYCILHTAYCTPHTAYCILHTAYCVLHTVYCILHTAYRVLRTAYCILGIERMKIKITVAYLFQALRSCAMSLLLVSSVWLVNLKLTNGIRFIAILIVKGSFWFVVL